MPAVELSYSPVTMDQTVRTLDAQSMEHLPAGLATPGCQLVDLDGEGAAGVLCEQAGGWTYKRSLSDKVSTPEIDQIYEAAMGAGATGGKILGAGGGGFLLLFVKPELQARVKERLKHLIHVPFGFETSGSRVIVYQPNGLT